MHRDHENKDEAVCKTPGSLDPEQIIATLQGEGCQDFPIRRDLLGYMEGKRGQCRRQDRKR